MKTGEILNYIKAAGLPQLRRLMFRNNLEKKITFKYFDVQQLKSGKRVEWVAFYYDQIREGDPLIKGVDTI